MMNYENLPHILQVNTLIFKESKSFVYIFQAVNSHFSFRWSWLKNAFDYVQESGLGIHTYLLEIVPLRVSLLIKLPEA